MLAAILDYQHCYQIKDETTYFNPIVRYTNDPICIFMNINENIRNKRKVVENLKGCTYNITHITAAHYSRLPKLTPNES